MNVWKLEWLRLVRTRRLFVLVAVFVIFGLIGALTAKYLPQLLSSASSETGLHITLLSEPKPVDGFAQYVKNVLQVGLLAAVIVAAYSLAIDAKPSLSAFYRTRITSVSTLIMPRFVIVTSVTLVSYVLGLLVAWYETAVLIGGAPAGDVLLGTAYMALYWVYGIAAVALVASCVRSYLATVGWSLAVIWLLPLIGIFKSIDEWLPSSLTTSLDSMLRGQHDGGFFVRSAIVTVLATAAFLVISLMRFRAREVDS